MERPEAPSSTRRALGAAVFSKQDRGLNHQHSHTGAYHRARNRPWDPMAVGPIGIRLCTQQKSGGDWRNVGNSPRRNKAAGMRAISYKDGDSKWKEYEGYRSMRYKAGGSKRS